MRYQQLPFSCGAAAVTNAIRCFGKRVPERVVRARAGTCFELGTQDEGMIAALATFGLKGTAFDEKNRGLAMNILVSHAIEGDPVILCVQNLQHWVTIIGMIGDRFILVDPANTVENKKENGIHVLSQKTLSKIWQSKNGSFSGIVVRKLS